MTTSAEFLASLNSQELRLAFAVEYRTLALEWRYRARAAESNGSREYSREVSRRYARNSRLWLRRFEEGRFSS